MLWLVVISFEGAEKPGFLRCFERRFACDRRFDTVAELPEEPQCGDQGKSGRGCDDNGAE